MSINSDIAVIGMAGRFPKSNNIEEFWENLKEAKDLITYFTAEELNKEGIDQNITSLDSYVKAKGLLPNIESFDYQFFEWSKVEAECSDPQHRVFMETAWSALENAGCFEEKEDERYGVYASCNTINSYLYNHLFTNQKILKTLGGYQLALHNAPEYLPTRLAYALNFHGPALFIHSACSSSLAVIHQACQGLLNLECDLALAGAVNWRSPNKTGYLYKEGMILSPDGHCRPFDRAGLGTVPSDGVGIVILKRLEDAIHDRNSIICVIKAVAINNDGKEKMNFTAPSVTGQSRVIADALAMADVGPESIDYIEAHGTATILGDPIEIKALQRIYDKSTASGEKPCYLGSVKSNVGHLDVAAGMVGFIKAALCLYNKEIPPTLYFNELNPNIQLHNKKFIINTETVQFKSENRPLCAAVSAFGIGGTNSHLILQQYQTIEIESKGCHHLERDNINPELGFFPISAKTSNALQLKILQLKIFLEKKPNILLKDVAYTLQAGRKHFSKRICFIAQTKNNLLASLNSYCDNGTRVTISNSNLENIAREWELEKLCNFDEISKDLLNIHSKLIQLPSYPFEKNCCWVELSGLPKVLEQKTLKLPSRSWYSMPCFVENPLINDLQYQNNRKQPAFRVALGDKSLGSILIITEDLVDNDLVKELLNDYMKVYVIGSMCKPYQDEREIHYQIDFFNSKAWKETLQEIEINTIQDILYFSCLQSSVEELPYAKMVNIFRQLYEYLGNKQVRLLIIGEDLYANINQVTLHGFANVLSQEHPYWNCKTISFDTKDYIQHLVNELCLDPVDRKISYNEGKRYTLEYRQVLFKNKRYFSEEDMQSDPNKVYYITGGIGGMGLVCARFLASRSPSVLVLVSRSSFPSPSEWAKLLSDPKTPTRLLHQIRSLQHIERSGSKCLIMKVDISNIDSIKESINFLETQHLKVTGCIHAAGNVYPTSMVTIKETDQQFIDLHFDPKVKGLNNLINCIDVDSLEFFICMSSLATSLGGVKYSSYSAANHYLNAICLNRSKKSKTRWLSINWDGWVYDYQKEDSEYDFLKSILITEQEGLIVLQNIFNNACGPVLNVSVRDYFERHREWKEGAQGVSNTNHAGLKMTFSELLNDLKSRWRSSLGLDIVDEQSDFYLCGGNSLISIQMSESINQDFEIPFLASHFLANSTIYKQAILIANFLGINAEESDETIED